jgi:hypothetical protein
MARTYRTVIGTYLTPEGTPKQGYIEFTPTHELVERPGARIPPTTVSAPLDENGQFSIDLIITENATIEPTGWKWLVDEKIKDGRTWYLEVPDSASPLDISYVFIPNSSSDPVYGIAGPQGPPGPGTPLLVLNQGAPIPGNTPDGTVILRKA